MSPRLPTRLRLRPRRPLLLALLAAATATSACASSGEEPAPDPTDPVLVVSSPARGTASADASLVVTGTVTDLDSGIESVVVNGVEALLDGDAFRAEITLVPGTNAIETTARDRSGNETTDVRAALYGELAAPGPVADAIALRVGPEALTTLGDTAASALLAADFTASLAAVNPVLDKGGSCLGAQADITSIAFDDADVSIQPSPRTLAIAATIADLEVGVHLDYDIACIGGRRDIVSRADSVALTVVFEPAVSGGAIVFDVTDASVSLAGVDLGIGGLPTALIELIVGDIEDKIGEALGAMLASELEPRLQQAFDQLTATRTTTVLDRALSISVEPRSISVGDDGIDITASSHIVASGAAGTGYVASPRAMPRLTGQLSASIADDAIGQAIGTLWAAGAFTREISLTGDSGADLGGGIADSVAIEALLPPIIDFESTDGARLEIADLIVRLSREGAPVTELAVSATLAITVGSGPKGLEMIAAEPTLRLQRLTPDGFLTEHDLGILEAFLASYLHGDLGALVGQIPLPSLAGTSVGAVDSETGTGYLTMDVALQSGSN